MTKTGKPRDTDRRKQRKAPRDVPDPRTKNQKHGQTTADKWNE